MVDENEQQKYLKEFNKYFPESDRESGIIKQIREDLEKIKQIVDLKERYQKYHPILRKYSESSDDAFRCYTMGRLREKGISQYDTINKYDKLKRELRNLVDEAGLEAKKSKLCHCSHCHQEINPEDALIICNKPECKEKLCPKTIENLKTDNNQIKSNQIKSNQIKSNQIKSNQIKSNQIKSNQIKSNQSSEQNVGSNSPKSYLPWILGGIGIVILIGILVYFLARKNNKKESGE